MTASGLQRIVFKRILEGDVKKLRAKSNDNPTEGGGARDFRFNPWPTFEPVFARMFPKVDTRTTVRREPKRHIEVDVRVGPLYWWDAETDSQQSREVEIWPPTAGRTFEGRIGQVHRLAPFAPDSMPPPTEGEVFCLFWQDDVGVWGSWVTERSLREDDWNPQVAKYLLGALKEAHSREAESKSGKPLNVRGYMDFVKLDNKVIIGRTEWQ